MVNDGDAPVLTLVGETADFQSPGGAGSPEWEHVVLRRTTPCALVCTDTMRSSTRNRLIRNRYIDVGLIYRLGRRLRSAQCVLAQSEQAGYQAALAMAALRAPGRLYIIFHGHRWWTRRNRAFAALVRRMPSVRLVCLSSSLRDLIVDEYGFRPEQVSVTGFGVDSNFFRPAEADEEPFIVSAGTASRDYRALVEASRGLAASVEIAADSTWYREDLNIADTPLPSNVRVFSAGSYAALRDLYRKARFVVVPLLDVRYACGYAVIAEAMAMGKAVIATRNQSPSDLIEDGVNGIYVTPGDVSALRAAMTKLLDDPAMARRMGDAARRAVESHFGLDAYVGRIKTEMGLVD